MQVGGINSGVEPALKQAVNTKRNEEDNSTQMIEKTELQKESAEKKPKDSINILVDDDSEIKKSGFYRENELKFSMHEETNRIMIKVINRNTKEVVKEIPEEKILDMIAKMYENTGLYIDKRK